MTDDTTKRGKADRIRINIKQHFEVRYWTKALGCTKKQLIDTVKEAGPMVPDVKALMIKRIKEAK